MRTDAAASSNDLPYQFTTTPTAAAAAGMSHEYAVGSRCWQPDAADGWVASTVKHKTVDGDKVTLVFAYDERDDVPTPEVCTLWGLVRWISGRVWASC